jgi:hypothetical protein
MLALFNRECTLNNFSEGLGFHHFCTHSPFNPPVEDYSEVFYIIHEMDILSVLCERSLSYSEPIREVDDLNFISIYFNVSALVPRLNSIETVLHLSKNIIPCMICGTYTSLIDGDNHINN